MSIDSTSSLQEAFHPWEPSLNGLRDEEVRFEGVGTCSVATSKHSDAAMSFDEKRFVIVKTGRDGKCAFHAIFGTPSEEQELKLHDIPGFIRSVLPPTLAELRQRLDPIGLEILTDVMRTVWLDFVCVHFKSCQDRVRLKYEPLIFQKVFLQAKYTELLAKCNAVYEENLIRKRQVDRAKEELHRSCRLLSSRIACLLSYGIR